MSKRNPTILSVLDRALDDQDRTARLQKLIITATGCGLSALVVLGFLGAVLAFLADTPYTQQGPGSSALLVGQFGAITGLIVEVLSPCTRTERVPCAEKRVEAAETSKSFHDSPVGIKASGKREDDTDQLAGGWRYAGLDLSRPAY